MTEQTNTYAPNQAAAPQPDLKSLEPLVGTWTLSGETTGTVTYDWMDGGFFLLQHVDMEHDGHRIKGLEIITAPRHRFTDDMRLLVVASLLSLLGGPMPVARPSVDLLPW